MNLYDQLLQLQQIPDAYTMWHSYREQVTKYLISQIEEGEHVAILGAGRSQDIDLAMLLPHVKTLTLWDKDAKILEFALKQYDLEGNEKVKLMAQDLLGVEAVDYRFYASQLVEMLRIKGRETAVEDLAKVGLEEVTRLCCKMQPIHLGDSIYDTIIVVGLHSQLLSMVEWIWHVILQTLGKDESQVRNAIIQYNKQIIELFQKQVLQAATKQVITGCELRRKGRDGSVQGAIQALEGLQRARLEGKLKLKSKCLLEWPFNEREKVIYEMLFQCDQIKK